MVEAAERQILVLKCAAGVSCRRPVFLYGRTEVGSRSIPVMAPMERVVRDTDLSARATAASTLLASERLNRIGTERS